ncbi:MAG: sigma 54-interacting transcriptional regulator [Sorangiineae bacterium]|nr:sigma 54-interacting transcriptional regulator [Polyangiaceae bacterium]MEB2322865.1 sigma 54-interacting transcriptional regulator [Sorangiineae bacterium]
MAVDTDALEPHDSSARLAGFRLTVVDGGSGAFESASGRCAVGTHESNDLCLDDTRVSRFQCEIVVDGSSARVRDLGSRNGTYVDGVRVAEAFLRAGSTLKLGGVTLRFEPLDRAGRVPLSPKTSFHGVVARSVAMRAALALVERAAKSTLTVLLEGETGTGKGKVAEAIHRGSDRSKGPFLVVDCGAIPANLIESELFGHEKSAFTGAGERRIGAFEEAAGGTLFLDELGELPLEQQPKLLRALESREIRRVGSNTHRKVDVRLVAATHRDLRREVNEGRFRADLYFRLAVLRIPLPPLRERADDLPALARALLRGAGARDEEIERLCTGEFIATLRRAAWPGNARELRNHLERCLAFDEALPIAEPMPARAEAAVDTALPYAEARRRAIEAFERAYVRELLAKHEGKVMQAAAAAGIDRVYLYRLARRHGL